MSEITTNACTITAGHVTDAEGTAVLLTLSDGETIMDVRMSPELAMALADTLETWALTQMPESAA